MISQADKSGVTSSQDSSLKKVRSVAEILVDIAKDRPDDFLPFFERAKDIYPNETASACIHYIAGQGLDKLGRQMFAWLRADTNYLEVLLDPKYVSDDVARKAIMLLRREEPHLFTKLFELPDKRETLAEDLLLRRALNLLGNFDNLAFCVRWLQKLTRFKDEHIRSKAVKWLCALRPDMASVQRHLKSEDGRVRANAIEALWDITTEEAELVFLGALGDSHHRAVANAIVGLHPINRDLAVETLTKFTGHPSPMFRLAMVWAIAHIGDGRCLDLLRQLAQDHSSEVKDRAQKALANFQEKQFASATPVSNPPDTSVLPAPPERPA